MQAQNNLDPTVFSFFDMAWVRKPWGLGKAQNPNSPIITLHLRFTKGASDHKTPGGGGGGTYKTYKEICRSLGETQVLFNT